jgi:hypothetical protein
MAAGVADESNRLVAEGNVDELVRHVDRLCEQRSWDHLERLRHNCRRAFERGHQLWPIATLIEYRLALRAPAPWAATVVNDGSGTLALGPLAEVAASTHTFAELAPHLAAGPQASVVAHERIVRGEDVSAWGRDPAVDPTVHRAVDPGTHPLIADDGVPWRIEAWEPRYPLAIYTDTAATFDGPPPVTCTELLTAAPATLLGADGATRALRELMSGWPMDGDAGVAVVAVEGDAAGAVAAIAPPGTHMGPMDPGVALATMAWAAAGGGGAGRRRGMARGRFDALWALAAVGGCDDDWPLEPDELGAIAGELNWWSFVLPGPTGGFALNLAVEDPGDGLAWAIAATSGT